MKTLTQQECQAELARIETIDALELELESAFDKVKDFSPTELLSLAPKVIMGGADPLSVLGLDPKLVDKAKLVAKANRIIREQRKQQLKTQSTVVIEEAATDE
ncbi:hypothetical protein BCU70_11755 [Vibrio sp. 10N.286.49.C2]|uniref:hypothetical protein n=1 Tax=unclassified Vibrio TaxID=2614977 RepID=UPI000C85113C|nr:MULTISPECIES: hypothetical protein [unclassified Vibrio]PMH40207.1 hypothetical protein BCU70_11755 [Vibrio sp. 10N.286.49.C2]PMH46340.1 hypothetical protein BCU66_01335 [Vibrio sp. 10N.286.49.B1]PMH82016.1 hypothetical protein BCU58_19490 [Vibrio sp. 10N.286.48.B7]